MDKTTTLSDLHLELKNWRGIAYLPRTRFLSGGRYVLHGRNGSGKSSVLDGLRASYDHAEKVPHTHAAFIKRQGATSGEVNALFMARDDTPVGSFMLELSDKRLERTSTDNPPTAPQTALDDHLPASMEDLLEALNGFRPLEADKEAVDTADNEFGRENNPITAMFRNGGSFADAIVAVKSAKSGKVREWKEITHATWGKNVGASWEPEGYIPVDDDIGEQIATLRYLCDFMPTACPGCGAGLIVKMTTGVAEHFENQENFDSEVKKIEQAHKTLADLENRREEHDQVMGALAIHQEIIRLDRMLQWLAPTGPESYREEKLMVWQSSLRQALARLSDGFGTAMIELDAKTGALMMGGRPEKYLSQGERWLARVGARLAILEVAGTDRAPIFLADDANHLDAAKWDTFQQHLASDDFMYGGTIVVAHTLSDEVADGWNQMHFANGELL